MGSIGYYINTISENSIQRPDTGKYDLIPQLTFSLDIESDKIDDINEQFYLKKKRPDYDEVPSNNVDSKAFGIFLVAYVELLGDNNLSTLLDCVKERK